MSTKLIRILDTNRRGDVVEMEIEAANAKIANGTALEPDAPWNPEPGARPTAAEPASPATQGKAPAKVADAKARKAK